MKWKECVLIALIFFGFGIIAGYLLHGHPTFESVINWIVGGISFAVVFEVGGFLREWYKERNEKRVKDVESKNESKTVSGRLLSEIYRNQKSIEPLYTFIKIFESGSYNFSENIKILKELKINRSIYSRSFDKLGLLDDESRKLIDNYYPELDNIENEFKKLEIIHGASHAELNYGILYSKFHENLGEIFSPSLDEQMDFLRHTQKVYDLGTDLIKSMKSN